MFRTDSTAGGESHTELPGLTREDLARYLARIGLDPAVVPPAAPPGAAGVELVSTVARAQLASIPFSNIDIHLGRVVSVAPDDIVAHLVDGRRGGICYELNGLLAAALVAMGFDARLVGGRVVTPAGLGPPLGHVAVIVDFGGDREQRLLDVGFGGSAVDRDAIFDGARRVEFPDSSAYELEALSRPLEDFVAMAWWHSTSPRSRFTGSLVSSITAGALRTTFSGRRDERGAMHYRLTRTNTDNGVRTAESIEPRRVPEVLVNEFAITVGTPPVVSAPIVSGQVASAG